MKKICFMLVCLLLINNTPSYAMKIIVNDTGDRVVYSRSTSHQDSDADAAFYAQQDANIDESGEYKPQKNIHPITYVRTYITDEQLNNLSSDFREELIGTYWDYSNAQNYDESEDNIMPAQNEIGTTLSNQDISSVYPFNKRGSREAADYYMIDSIKDPNTAVPSGFPQ